MRIAYRRMAAVLAAFGATMRDVVDETIYVTDMRAASAAAREVRAEAYGTPVEVASTLIGVACIRFARRTRARPRGDQGDGGAARLTPRVARRVRAGVVRRWAAASTCGRARR